MLRWVEHHIRTSQAKLKFHKQDVYSQISSNTTVIGLNYL